MYLLTDNLGHSTILDDDEAGRSMYARPHRSKNYYKDPVQQTDKYGKSHTYYRWRDGSVNRLPEGLD